MALGAACQERFAALHTFSLLGVAVSQRRNLSPSRFKGWPLGRGRSLLRSRFAARLVNDHPTVTGRLAIRRRCRAQPRDVSSVALYRLVCDRIEIRLPDHAVTSQRLKVR